MYRNRRNFKRVMNGFAILMVILGLSIGSIHPASAIPALVQPGEMVVWGYNAEGQLGLGDNLDRSTPQILAFTQKFSAISAGWFHTLAVLEDKTVVGWGMNNYGEVGDGTSGVLNNRSLPVPVSGLSGAINVFAGAYHSLALKSDGTVWAWGNNTQGQLGDGSYTSRPLAQPVLGLTGVSAISGGWGHTLALKSDGTVWSWGLNQSGQLGYDSSTACPAPLAAAPLLSPNRSSTQNAVISISNDHLLNPLTDESIGLAAISNAPNSKIVPSGSGNNPAGPTANNALSSFAFSCPTPSQIPGLTGIIAIAAGYQHSLALRYDGVIFSWGNNEYGQLGNSSNDISRHPTPAVINGLANMKSISAGYFHSIAVRADGIIMAWGRNTDGQLGNGLSDGLNQTSPSLVVNLAARSVSAGAFHNVAIALDGTIWTWGWNGYGQLGNGLVDANPHPTPLLVPDYSNLSAAFAGYAHTISFVNTRKPWDVNGDHVIDIGDIAAIGLHWGETGVPGWIPEDVDSSGTIDIGDVAVVGIHWGETY